MLDGPRGMAMRISDAHEHHALEQRNMPYHTSAAHALFALDSTCPKRESRRIEFKIAELCREEAPRRRHD